jgi:hypothetical protein
MDTEKTQETLDKLRAEVGTQKLGPHRGGYLSQDEYATLIYYWAGEDHSDDPGLVDGVIATLANCGWARTPDRKLPRMGTVLAFEELYPDKKAGWRSSFPEMYRSFSVVTVTTPQQEREWNDFHIAQWFVLRRARRDEGVEIIDKLLDRVAEGGSVGYDAQEAMQIVASQCKPFEMALERAKRERLARMVIQ